MNKSIKSAVSKIKNDLTANEFAFITTEETLYKNIVYEKTYESWKEKEGSSEKEIFRKFNLVKRHVCFDENGK